MEAFIAEHRALLLIAPTGKEDMSGSIVECGGGSRVLL